MKIDLRDIPIIYMNMDDDKRRYRDMNILFDDLIEDFGFNKENIHRVPGMYRESVKAVGVATAHLAALQFAERFDGPFLLLEDDLELADFGGPVLDVPDDSDAVYLGTMQFGVAYAKAYARGFELPPDGITVNVIPDVYPDNPDIYRVLSMTGGQSILYITKTYQTIVKNSCQWAIADQEPHDTYLATMQRLANIYCYNRPKFINKSCRWDSTFMLEQAFYNKGRPFRPL